MESDACGADVGVADVDGSGTPDIVAACLNAPLEEVGSVEVYTRRGASDWDAIGWLEGTQAYGWFGRPAVGGFDLGADGVPELALGEQHVDDTLRSVVHVIEGPWRGHCTLEALGARRLWNDYVPARLTTGDLDGDGVKELVATEAGQPAWRAEATVGQVRVVRDVVIEDTDADAASWLTFEGAVPEESFGADAAVGDFNGDGCADVAVGAPGFAAAGGPGRVYVFHGPFAGGTVPLGAAQVVLEGAADGDGFGGRLEVGDFDGDGVDDLAVAAPYDGRAAWEAGAVYVLAAVRP
ncbi:MAG: hypothetical protein R3F59_25580 [Myxococcota bacterium]